MHPRFTGPIARVAAVAAFTTVLLPALAGPVSAATATSTTETVAAALLRSPWPITLQAKFTSSTPITMTGGPVSLTAGVTYSWTFGLFNPAPASNTQLYSAEEPIVAVEIKPLGGLYDLTCTIQPVPATSEYYATCGFFGAKDGSQYMTNRFTVPAPSFAFGWQMSFVATSRVKPTTTQSKPPTYDSGQCTYGAVRQVGAHYGYYPPGWSDARYWFLKAANTSNWSTSYGPQSNSVVVFQPGSGGSAEPTAGKPAHGHVGWVEGIEFRTDGNIYLHTTEMNINKSTGSVHRILMHQYSGMTSPPSMGYILPGK